MKSKKKILAICGSATRASSNLAILKYIKRAQQSQFDVEILDDPGVFPPFRTEQTDSNVPPIIRDLRNKIVEAKGIIICTPEYIFSIPSGLKNIIEWCVSTTVFSDKPVGLITASASGEKGHEELQLIMQTIQASFSTKTTLLIQGVKGKISAEGTIDGKTQIEIQQFINAFFRQLI